MAKEKDLQKIQQASGVTSDTTVRMVDASGNSVQIDRDVFMQAIRDVLPSVLSDQGTNATKVSTLNSSNVLGTSTIANLASVLGGMMSRTSAVNKNLSNYTTNGTYGINAETFVPSDIPSGACSYGVMHVNKNNYVTTQDVYGITGSKNERWQRYSDNDGNSWSQWRRLDNFGCNTLAELKAALANV